jgi:hypothetical protein
VLYCELLAQKYTVLGSPGGKKGGGVETFDLELMAVERGWGVYGTEIGVE